MGKVSDFVAEQWLRADGDGRSADDEGLRKNSRCDRAGCVVDDGRRSIAFVQDLSAFDEDCRRAVVLLTRLKAPAYCSAALVLDRDALAARGATVIRFTDVTMEIRSVRKGTETLSWIRSPKEETGGAPPRERPRLTRPVPEQDLPEEEFSSGEPD